ncbi:hypothetical protein JAO71_00005 [Olleya sp. YSTF-M6]|uniref:Uncharacterized protein n=1 Tax=Olleya sediminilitoris TaxID=2795739 RepID=A0ABS1WGB6_9FLAO|nr:hypothetical protein [Olleya sediminilitoris]MBL7558166.1 hypothetical protein [Olleya sediminilitoris]
MKTLKITLVALFSIVLLSAVSTLNDAPTASSETTVKPVEVKLLATSGIKKNKIPTQG